MYRYTYIGMEYTPNRVLQDRRLYAVAICHDDQYNIRYTYMKTNGRKIMILCADVRNIIIYNAYFF